MDGWRNIGSAGRRAGRSQFGGASPSLLTHWLRGRIRLSYDARVEFGYSTRRPQCLAGPGTIFTSLDMALFYISICIISQYSFRSKQCHDISSKMLLLGILIWGLDSVSPSGERNHSPTPGGSSGMSV